MAEEKESKEWTIPQKRAVYEKLKKDLGEDQKEKNMADDLAVTELDRIKHEKIEKAKNFEKRVNDAVAIGSILEPKLNKLEEELCTGKDCLKNKVERGFEDINQRIRKIESNVQMYTCDICGQTTLMTGDSFCRNCGTKIPQWLDDDGNPMNWTNYIDRS